MTQPITYPGPRWTGLSDTEILKGLGKLRYEVVIIGTESANGKSWRTFRWVGHDIDAAKRDLVLYQWQGQRLYQRDSSGQWTELTALTGNVKPATE